MTAIEAQRLATVDSLAASGLSSEAIDSVTHLAANLFDVPVSLVTLLDAQSQHFVSAFGTDAERTERGEAFCNFALDLGEGDVLHVPNALADVRFADNPLVHGDMAIRAYTGAPLRIDGQTVGTLCIIDTKIRPPLRPDERDTLLALAKVTSELMEKARDVRLREEAQQALADERVRLEFALNAADIVAWEYDAQTKAIVWHRDGYRTFGLKEEEAGHPNAFLDLIHADEREPIAEHLARVVAGEEPTFRATFRVLMPGSEYHWMASAGEMHRTSTGQRLFGVTFDVTDEHRLMEARDMAARELRHRIKNLIAIVMSIAAGTARGASDLEGFMTAFRGRLTALAMGQDALLAEAATPPDLAALCEGALAPFAANEANTLSIDVEKSAIAPKLVQTLSMILHELATNAVKHGALGDDDGHVSLEGHSVEGRLRLVWDEVHGRGCREQRSTGFGRMLIERAVAGVDGQLTYDWRPQGLRCEISLPV